MQDGHPPHLSDHDLTTVMLYKCIEGVPHLSVGASYDSTAHVQTCKSRCAALTAVYESLCMCANMQIKICSADSCV